MSVAIGVGGRAATVEAATADAAAVEATSRSCFCTTFLPRSKSACTTYTSGKESSEKDGMSPL